MKKVALSTSFNSVIWFVAQVTLGAVITLLIMSAKDDPETAPVSCPAPPPPFERQAADEAFSLALDVLNIRSRTNPVAGVRAAYRDAMDVVELARASMVEP